MGPDVMSVRLHLRRIRLVAVLVDLIERLTVEVADARRVVRCPHCGFKTTRVHDVRRLRVRDLPAHGRPTALEWARRRFVCGKCDERHWEDHPEIILGRRTHVTRRPSPSAGPGLLGYVDPGGVTPIRVVVALPHGPHSHLVGSGGPRASPAPLPDPADRRDQSASWAPVCDGDHQRRHRRNFGDRGASQRQGPQHVPCGPGPSVAAGGEGGGLGRVGRLSGFDPTSPRPRHPRPGQIPRGPLVCCRDDRSPTSYPTDRPHGIEARLREPEIFRSRYLQLTRFDHLADDRIEALGRLLSGRPELEAAWRMLQHLYGIHLAQDTDDANQSPGAFLEVYQPHRLIEFEKLTETLLEWGDEIFAFHDTDRATNGRVEGTNNRLSVLKRVAYGFTNAANLGTRALLLTPGMATSP